MLQKMLRNMLQYTARHAANMLQQTWSYLFECVLSNPAISGGRACPKKGIVVFCHLFLSLSKLAPNALAVEMKAILAPFLLWKPNPESKHPRLVVVGCRAFSLCALDLSALVARFLRHVLLLES
jgi:hypothetical protein